MIRVLVIEDDAGTAAEIAEDFAAAGFTVVHEADGPSGLARARAEPFDVVTLDRMLPGLDGLALLDRMRAAGVTAPVLVLSALSSVDERIRGLRAGGDDYLAKPFVAAELRARVEVLARRPVEREGVVLRFEGLHLDLIDRTARRGGRTLDLGPREFKFLELLIRHHGHVVPRTMLFERVWGVQFDPGSNVVDVHLGKLRRKVDGPGEPPLIHTVRGVGFVLRAPVR